MTKQKTRFVSIYLIHISCLDIGGKYIIPTVEAANELSSISKVGVLATSATVHSETFVAEFAKMNSKIEVVQQAAPLLVPLIENGGMKWVDPILHEYLQPLMDAHVDIIVLGCTHYPILKERVREFAGKNIRIISQDEVIPEKLGNYLERHPEIEATLSKNYERKFLVTDKTSQIEILAKEWFGNGIELEVVDKI